MKNSSHKSSTKKDNQSALAEAIVEAEENVSFTKFPQNLRNNLLQLIKKRDAYLGGTILVATTFIANVLNYIFNAYLGRVLSFGDFALIGLISGFFSFASIPFGAYSTTVTYKSSFLIGRYGDSAGYKYWQYMSQKVKYLALAIALLWLAFTPLLMNYFHTDNSFLFILFALVLLVGFFNNINQGFLSAKMMFGSMAFLSLIEPIVKLTTVFILVALGLQIWTFSAIPLAAIIVFLVAWMLVIRRVPKEKSKAPLAEVHHFSKQFFTISLLTTFSSLAYFTFDIFLAKHYLSPSDAGKYALVSLVGKMVYFLGNLTSPFVIPLLSRSEGAKKNSLRTLYILLGFTGLSALVGFLLFGLLGYITVPLLYGSKAIAIVAYLPYFTFGMMCYTISSVLISYYLVRKIYTFTIATSLLIVLQLGLLNLFHNSVQSITIVMAAVLTIHLLITTILHFNANAVKKYELRLAAFLHKPVKKSKTLMRLSLKEQK